MKLLTKEIERKLPALYTGENAMPNERKIIVKFFAPWTSWTWYATEYDPENGLFYGLVDGFKKEFGYFGLEELKNIRGPFGLKIERDMHYGFDHTLDEVM